MGIISILQVIFYTSLSGMIFIFLRNLPLLCSFEPMPVSEEKRLAFRVKKRMDETKIRTNEGFHRWSEKTIRRLRLIVLKIDNSLSSYLKKIRERKIHFFRKKK